MAIDRIRIVLIEPAHPGNIGAVARAMKTMSFSDLVLVRPAEFPSEEADRRAMGAIDILQRARIVDDMTEAVADCELVIGGSARERTFPHEVLDARACGERLVAETELGASAALIFGPERTGLENQDLDRCGFQVVIPANEAFSSLNLASAVQLLCYEAFVAEQNRVSAEATGSRPVRNTGEIRGESRGRGREEAKPVHQPSSQIEMEAFFEHLERALDSRGYLDGDMREVTLMKLRRLFGRARPSRGEIKLLHTLTRFMHRDGG
jgi:tRNA (cytidine32/uridine32-2'-O)-methyltransferase